MGEEIGQPRVLRQLGVCLARGTPGASIRLQLIDLGEKLMRPRRRGVRRFSYSTGLGGWHFRVRHLGEERKLHQTNF